MTIFNIFCDASVGPQGKGSCAGALVEKMKLPEEKKEPEILDKKFYALIQPHGTNNTGEISAICLAVVRGVEIYTEYVLKRNEEIRINVFSDSLISIKGVRDWMPNWLKNIDSSGTLYGSANKEVKNQWYFKYIYNLIILNPGFKIHFYHQDGHVTKGFNTIIPRFRNFNGIYLSDLMLTPAHICINNDFVDRETRKIINGYLMTNDTFGYPVEAPLLRGDPMSDLGYHIIDNSEDAIKRYLYAIT